LQIRELTAKIKALEGDPNDPKPVTLTQEEFDKLQTNETELQKLK
jgi:hypothetical protein